MRSRKRVPLTCRARAGLTPAGRVRAGTIADLSSIFVTHCKVTFLWLYRTRFIAMGAVITRHASGDGAPTLTLSEEILFKVNRGASSIYSTLLSLLRRDAPSPELYRQKQWVRISDDVRNEPKGFASGFALVVVPATTTDCTIRVRIAQSYDADLAKAARLSVPESETWRIGMRAVDAESGVRGVVTDIDEYYVRVKLDDGGELQTFLDEDLRHMGLADAAVAAAHARGEATLIPVAQIRDRETHVVVARATAPARAAAAAAAEVLAGACHLNPRVLGLLNRVSLETRYENTRFELEALFGATLAAASAAADIATEYAIEATKAMLLSEPKALTILLTTREWRSEDDDEKLRKLVRDNGGSGWVREEVDGEKLPYGRATFPKPGVRLAYDAKDALLSDPLVLGVSAGGGDYRLLFR